MSDQRSALDRLPTGQPVVLLVKLADNGRSIETPYYGYYYGINANDHVELKYGLNYGTTAFLPVQDVLQVSVTNEEGLGRWGAKANAE